MKKKVTAVFDIGKTNKKFFLFDVKFQEVYREYMHFDEIEDADGFPSENLEALENWIKEVFNRMLSSHDFDIQMLNFSSYGASLVHIDEKGKALHPLYSYLKPLPKEITASFSQKYGPEDELYRSIGSPKLGMLNSGIQLYWLKRFKPEFFKKIKYSLHLPQYLSYCFTGIRVSEYTSIGCHTALWDFQKGDYHNWVRSEGFDCLFPEITESNTTVTTSLNGKDLEIGVGIHDSSASLLPYFQETTKSFLLISTGTWSISLNPFNREPLTKEELNYDCLYFMQIDGSPVKASRLFLGQEYKFQLASLAKVFEVSEIEIEKIAYQQSIEVQKEPQFHYKFLTASDTVPSVTDYAVFDNSAHAYHQLLFELTELQYASSMLAIGNTMVEKVYIDGGFAQNQLFTEFLKRKFKGLDIVKKEFTNGSALGAAMVMNQKQLTWKLR